MVLTTWRPVSEFPYFGAMCEALIEIGESDIADMMRVPFDVMPGSELPSHFDAAGFVNVKLSQQEQDLALDGELEHVVAQGIEIPYSTPIGPKLKDLPDEKQTQFRKAFSERLTTLGSNGTNLVLMVTNVLSAQKPG